MSSASGSFISLNYCMTPGRQLSHLGQHEDDRREKFAGLQDMEKGKK